MKPKDGLACPDVLELLEPYVDGELAQLRSVQLERHLAGCTACQEELSWALEVREGLRAMPAVSCPPAVVQNVLRQVRAESRVEPEPAPWWSRLGSFVTWPAAATLAAALLALAVGAVVLLHAPAPTPSPRIAQAPNPSETAYSSAELAEARRQARLALAYFGEINERAGLAIRNDVIAERVAAVPRLALQNLAGLPSTEPRPEETP